MLWNQNLNYVGTLKSNKPEIPAEFLKDKKRPVESSLFGFSDYFTITSYVPSKNKAIVILSTKHHNANLDSYSRKP